MIEPTRRLLRLCDKYGAKLTIMADVAEILKFKEYKEATGRDDYYYEEIIDQLRRAIETGHDVQLHIHSSYFNANHENSQWIQDWSEYNFATLPYERMHWMIKSSKEFLEELLKPVDPRYGCVAFRAANWAVSPSKSVVRALANNGIKIDTSVFKYGRRDGLVSFDYSGAQSEIMPWRAKEEDICSRDDRSSLWEVPIYSEHRWIGAFLTPSRIYRVITGWPHRVRRPIGMSPHTGQNSTSPRVGATMRALFKKHAWKADFNQCSSRQLLNTLGRVSSRYNGEGVSVPLVLIGHSKLFTRHNEINLTALLAHAGRYQTKFRFDTLSSINHLLSGSDHG
jgi:hypothetical protein